MVITIIAVVAIATGIYIYNILHNEEGSIEIVEEGESVKEIEYELEADHVLVENLPSPEDEFSMTMNEEEVLYVIHAMSHQKVRAKVKWSFILMTPERVDRMVEIVEANDYKYRERYLDILYRWQEGDFSQADKDHNYVWHLQRGTVGKAKGLLSPQEELEFIQSRTAGSEISEEEDTH